MRFPLLLLFVVFSVSAVAQNHFTFTPKCHQSIDEIYKLKLKNAEVLIAESKSDDAENLIPVFLEDYIDFFRVYISEDELLYYDLLDKRHERLELLESGPKDSPYYLYCLAEAYLHWAIVRLKFEEYMGAFVNVKKAYHLLEKNRKQFPDFIQNLKSLSILHTVIGSIPENYKWGADILGMEGSISQGVDELEELKDYCTNHDLPFEEEVKLIQPFLQLHLLSNGGVAWEMVNREDFLAPDNLLSFFTKASIASYTGQNDSVLAVVDRAPEGPEYIELNFMDYLKGVALVRQLDTAGIRYLKKYVDEFGGRNYIKESWQKIGWMRLIAGDIAGYKKAMQKVKTQGFAIIDEDKVALDEANSSEVPNALLLKARLLFDGGYYPQALKQIKKKDLKDFTTVRERLEFNYRLGRIYQQLGENEKAIEHFIATVKADSGKTSFYFAPNACLQLGLIFEREGDYPYAKYYYNQAVKYKKHAYENGIESQAKAGIKRLSEQNRE